MLPEFLICGIKQRLATAVSGFLLLLAIYLYIHNTFLYTTKIDIKRLLVKFIKSWTTRSHVEGPVLRCKRFLVSLFNSGFSHLIKRSSITKRAILFSFCTLNIGHFQKPAPHLYRCLLISIAALAKLALFDLCWLILLRKFTVSPI